MTNKILNSLQFYPIQWDLFSITYFKKHHLLSKITLLIFTLKRKSKRTIKRLHKRRYLFKHHFFTEISKSYNFVDKNKTLY